MPVYSTRIQNTQWLLSILRHRKKFSQSIASLQSKINIDRWSECETSKLAWCNQQFVRSPACRMDRWKTGLENFQPSTANINPISSYYRSHHHALSCLIRLCWNRSENARIWSLSSALAPIIFQFAQPHCMRSEKNRLGGAKLHTQSYTELLLLSLRTDETWLDRIYSSLWGISCGLTRKIHHLSHHPVYLPIGWILLSRDAGFFVAINRLDQTSIDVLFILWISTFIMNWERSSELNGKSFCLVSASSVAGLFSTLSSMFGIWSDLIVPLRSASSSLWTLSTVLDTAVAYAGIF